MKILGKRDPVDDLEYSAWNVPERTSFFIGDQFLNVSGIAHHFLAFTRSERLWQLNYSIYPSTETIGKIFVKEAAKQYGYALHI